MEDKRSPILLSLLFALIMVGFISLLNHQHLLNQPSAALLFLSTILILVLGLFTCQIFTGSP